jgi:hypothetical protein
MGSASVPIPLYPIPPSARASGHVLWQSTLAATAGGARHLVALSHSVCTPRRFGRAHPPRGGRCGVLVELVLVGEGVKGAADKLLLCAASCEGAFPGGAGLANFYICHRSDLFGRGGGARARCIRGFRGPWPRAPGVGPHQHKARPDPEPHTLLRNARRGNARAAPLPLPGLVARLAVRPIAPRRCFILCAARALRRRLPACIARTQIFPRVGRRCLDRVAACCC